MSIHPTAIIDPSAQLGTGVTVGPYSIIGADVEIGDDTWVGPHVVINGPTRIGKENKIFQFASVGEAPQDLKYKGEPTPLEIGDRNVIREGVTIHRGTPTGRGMTTMGDDCFILANSHIGHDCRIGNNVILANAALAGHTTIGDFVNMGGGSLVHQFCSIGAYSFVGGGSAITRDIPPYLIVNGNPGSPRGLNRVGLKRRGFSDAQIRRLTEVYKILYLRDYDLAEATRQIEALAEDHEEVQRFVDFLKQSHRGIIR